MSNQVITFGTPAVAGQSRQSLFDDIRALAEKIDKASEETQRWAFLEPHWLHYKRLLARQIGYDNAMRAVSHMQLGIFTEVPFHTLARLIEASNMQGPRT